MEIKSAVIDFLICEVMLAMALYVFIFIEPFLWAIEKVAPRIDRIMGKEEELKTIKDYDYYRRGYIQAYDDLAKAISDRIRGKE